MGSPDNKTMNNVQAICTPKSDVDHSGEEFGVVAST
jgi:hypothetical protein